MFDETLFLRLAARIYHVDALFYQGRLREAATLADASMRTAEQAGYEAHALWGLCFWAEAQRMLGGLGAAAARVAPAVRLAEEAALPRDRARIQVVAARNLLAQGRLTEARTLAARALQGLSRAPATAARLRVTAARATAAEGAPDAGLALLGSARGVQGYELCEHRLARAEILLWAGRVSAATPEALAVEATALAAGWRWLCCRSRLVVAEALFRQAEFAAATAAWQRARVDAEQEGYAAERLLAGLIGAALARARGDGSAAEASLGTVATQASEHGFTLEGEAAAVAQAVLARETRGSESPGARLARRLLLAEPATCRMREAQGTSWLTPAQATTCSDRGHDLFVNLVTGRVKVRRRRIDLSHREGLLCVVRALAASPGQMLPLDVLVQEAWGVEYHPLRHRARVSQAIARLRRLLGTAAIDGTRGGYRFVPGDSWAVVEAAPGGQ